VDLAHAGDNHLLGLIVPVEMHGGVFFDQAVDGRDDLVLVSPAFGFDGERHDRGRRRNLFIDDGILFAADGVTGARFLQFGKGGDITGNDNFCRFLSLAFEEEDIAETFRQLAGGVVHPRVGGQDAGIDPKEGQAARIGVGNGLENQGGKGRGFFGEAYFLFFSVRLFPLDRSAINGRGQVLDDEVHQQVRADIFQGRAANHGNDPPRMNARLQSAAQLVVGQLPGVEVFVHHRFVRFGDVLHHGFPQALGLLLQIGGNVGGPAGSLKIVVDQGLHGKEVHHSAEGIVGADGQADRCHLDVHLCLDAGHGGLEIGPLTIHTVDKYQAG